MGPKGGFDLGGLFDRYKLKFSFMKDNLEVTGFELKFDLKINIFHKNYICLLYIMDLQSLKPNTDSDDASPISKMTESLSPQSNSEKPALPSINPLEALGSNNKNIFSKFQDNKIVEGSKDFLTSNTAVAKISFLLLIVLIFTILMRIGSKILAYIIMPKKNPYIVKGLKDGKKMVILEQNPSKNGAVPIFRSDNKRGGIEFTYSGG